MLVSDKRLFGSANVQDVASQLFQALWLCYHLYATRLVMHKSLKCLTDLVAGQGRRGELFSTFQSFTDGMLCCAGDAS